MKNFTDNSPQPTNPNLLHLQTKLQNGISENTDWSTIFTKNDVTFNLELLAFSEDEFLFNFHLLLSSEVYLTLEIEYLNRGINWSVGDVEAFLQTLEQLEDEDCHYGGSSAYLIRKVNSQSEMFPETTLFKIVLKLLQNYGTFCLVIPKEVVDALPENFKGIVQECRNGVCLYEGKGYSKFHDEYDFIELCFDVGDIEVYNQSE
ncbi:MAG: hypothetical protein ACRCWQ_06130 [Bacilli bacterium]